MTMEDALQRVSRMLEQAPWRCVEFFPATEGGNAMLVCWEGVDWVATLGVRLEKALGDFNVRRKGCASGLNLMQLDMRGEDAWREVEGQLNDWMRQGVVS